MQLFRKSHSFQERIFTPPISPNAYVLETRLVSNLSITRLDLSIFTSVSLARIWLPAAERPSHTQPTHIWPLSFFIPTVKILGAY